MPGTTINELFQNAAVLITFVVVYDLFAQYKFKIHVVLNKILLGVSIGLLGVVLIYTAYRSELTYFIDARSVLLSISGLFFGAIPTLIAMGITILFRVFQGGEAVWIGVTIILSTGFFGLIVRHFWYKKLINLSHVEIFLFALFNHVVLIMMILVVTWEISLYLLKTISIPILIIFPLISTIICFLLQNRMKREHDKSLMQETIQRLNLALNAAELLFFDRDLIQKTITFSDHSSSLLQDIQKKNQGKFENLETYIHPDDLEAFLSNLENARIHNESMHMDLKLITTSRTTRWIHFVCRYFFDDANTPVRIIGVIKDITTEKQMEESLAESESRFRSILENAPDGIFVNTNGLFSYVNPKLVELLKAKDQTSLIGTNILDKVAPEYRHKVQARIEYQKETGKNAKLMEQEYIRMDGSKIAVTTTAAPIKYQGKDSYLVFVHDLSIRKKTEEQIKKLSLAVEQSPVSIIISDLNGTVEYVNPKFSEVTGYSLHEIVGKNPRILKSDFTSDEEYKVLWETIISGKVWSGVFKNVKKDGTQYWESATISPIKNGQGDITHYVAIKEDITEKRQIHADLLEAKNKAEESNQLKSHFLANMSHEIRTPLNGILGFLDLIKDESLTESERNDYIDIIIKSGSRLLNTINDIIEMSKLEAGYSKVDIDEINLYDMLIDLCNFFKPQTDDKGVLLKVRINDSISSVLQNFATDKNKINGILTNVIKNAIKFTAQGAIDIIVEKQESGVLIKVKDTGIGIPEDKVEAIFDRFIQADISNTRGYEGSGLGLSISKAYIELLQGKIWAESELGKGSTFFIFLPFLIASDKMNDSSSKPLQPLKNDGKIYTVLVAEDEEDNFQFLKIVLKKLGFKIARAVNGKEAVQFVKEQEIDIVLMDIKMPEMTGIEAVKEIRTFNKSIPVIAQSAFFMDDNENLVNENGFNDYIMKPIKKDQLYLLLKKYL